MLCAGYDRPTQLLSLVGYIVARIGFISKKRSWAIRAWPLQTGKRFWSLRRSRSRSAGFPGAHLPADRARADVAASHPVGWTPVKLSESPNLDDDVKQQDERAVRQKCASHTPPVRPVLGYGAI